MRHHLILGLVVAVVTLSACGRPNADSAAGEPEPEVVASIHVPTKLSTRALPPQRSAEPVDQQLREFTLLMNNSCARQQAATEQCSAHTGQLLSSMNRLSHVLKSADNSVRFAKVIQLIRQLSGVSPEDLHRAVDQKKVLDVADRVQKQLAEQLAR